MKNTTVIIDIPIPPLEPACDEDVFAFTDLWPVLWCIKNWLYTFGTLNLELLYLLKLLSFDIFEYDVLNIFNMNYCTVK